LFIATHKRASEKLREALYKSDVNTGDESESVQARKKTVSKYIASIYDFSEYFY